jgi:hypothetical protein
MSCCPSYSYAFDSLEEATDADGWIAVARDDETTYIDPDSLGRMIVDGRVVVPLAELWNAAELPGELSELLFHFASDDGFNTCEESDLGMPALLLEHAFVDAITRDLIWTIEVPSAFEVRGVATISAQHASEFPEIEIAAE